MGKEKQLINQKEFAVEVEDKIVNEAYHCFARVFVELMDKYHFTPAVDTRGFEDKFHEAAASDIRDTVLALYEECGMDIEGDGREF